MADQQDSLRIHLSLVSHTNIGKTTLARTLLMRDVGEIADRAHVTETTDDYLLARGQDGSELILWDTPGFGNSVALAKRLEGRSNPLGWFLSEVWDRFTNKSFWLDQKAVRHIRDISSVVLYLVNIAEIPDKTPYIQAEMQILSWIGKPVIVLLNQMGKPQAPDIEHAQVEAWKTALKTWPFVKKVLAMDAFARCWVQKKCFSMPSVTFFLLRMRPLTKYCSLFGAEAAKPLMPIPSKLWPGICNKPCQHMFHCQHLR